LFWGWYKPKEKSSKSILEDLGLAVLAILGLGGEESSVDVGDNTTSRDGNVGKKLVQLLVVTDGKHNVTGDNTDTLVVAGSVTGKLENLSSQVLEDGGEVDGSTNTNTASILTLTKLTVKTSDRERQASTERSGLVARLASGSSSSRLGGLTLGRHDVLLFGSVKET
jgi:hypothetical protein